MGLHFSTDGLTGQIAFGPATSEGWRNCFVSVRAFGFAAEYTCDARDMELRSLLASLEGAVANIGQTQEIHFSTLERGFKFDLHLDRRGHLEGTYEFTRDWRGPCLSGRFSADQTHLACWAQELRVALA
jgi:hypothetical protein